MARILHRLNVDFAILGNEEKCAGESTRMVGEAGLFERWLMTTWLFFRNTGSTV